VSVRTLKDAGIGQSTRKQFVGTKVKLADLENKEIVVNEFVELNSKLPNQQNQTYLLISAKEGTMGDVVFTTQSGPIKDILNKAKSILPIKCFVRHVKSKSGPFSYWTLE
jgi:hypothetical protein